MLLFTVAQAQLVPGQVVDPCDSTLTEHYNVVKQEGEQIWLELTPLQADSCDAQVVRGTIHKTPAGDFIVGQVNKTYTINCMNNVKVSLFKDNLYIEEKNVWISPNSTTLTIEQDTVNTCWANGFTLKEMPNGQLR